MPSIRRRVSTNGTVIFHADFRVEGDRLVLACDTLDEAVALVKTDPDFDGFPKPPFHLEDLVVRHVARCHADGLRSTDRMERRLKSVLDEFEGRLAASITAGELDAFAMKLARTRAYGSVCRTIGYLGGVLREAVKSELLNDNPAIGVVARYQPPGPAPANDVVGKKDTLRLIAAAQSVRDELYLRLVLECGLTAAEIVVLRFEDLDEEGLRVARLLADGGAIMPVSPHRDRTVPVTVELREAVGRQASELGVGGNANMFPGRGCAHCAVHTVHHAVSKAQLSCGLLDLDAQARGERKARYTAEQLRLRAAVRWLEDDVSPKLACRWFGTGKFSNFLNKFRAFMPEPETVPIDRLDQLIWPGDQPNQRPPSM